MPLGLTIATTAIYNAFLAKETSKALLHGHSFTGNPLACALACASLDLFEEEDTVKNLAMLSEWQKSSANMLGGSSFYQNVRSIGTILAFEVVCSDDYFSNLRNQLYHHFLDRSILLRPLGNTVFINPPYCIRRSEYETILRAVFELEQAIRL